MIEKRLGIDVIVETFVRRTDTTDALIYRLGTDFAKLIAGFLGIESRKIGEQVLATSGDGKDAYDLEFYNWAATIREGKPNACDPETALKVAVAIIKANEAMAKGVKLEISPSLYAV